MYEGEWVTGRDGDRQVEASSGIPMCCGRGGLLVPGEEDTRAPVQAWGGGGLLVPGGRLPLHSRENQSPSFLGCTRDHKPGREAGRGLGQAVQNLLNVSSDLNVFLYTFESLAINFPQQQSVRC